MIPAQLKLLKKARLFPIMRTKEGYCHSNGETANRKVVNNLCSMLKYWLIMRTDCSPVSDKL